MSPDVRIELQQLLSALCDRQLTETQQARLDEVLATDADCRRLYLEYMDMHARLLVHARLGSGKPLLPETGKAAAAIAGAVPAANSPNVLPFVLPRRRRRFPPVVRYGVVAAGTLAASVLLQFSFWYARPVDDKGAETPASVAPPMAGYVATLAQAVDCTWENRSEPWRIGSRLLPGELRLRKGIARICIDGGPDLVIEGPTHLRIDSSSAATVMRGKVVFRADKTAAPFDLHTPSATLADFGTEYAVAVGPEGEEVHVFDGEVQRTSKSAEPEHLKTGEARRYGSSPAGPGEDTTLDPARFVRQLLDQDPPPHDPVAGLLAYEGFDYKNPEEFRAGKANGGFGWSGPWTSGFARPLNVGDENRLALNAVESLVRPGAGAPSAGGCFDYAGFAKYWRRLAMPIRLDVDGVYYLSFLFRRQGPAADPVNALALLLWTTDDFQQKGENSRQRLNIGVGGANELFTHLQQVGSRTSLPLNQGETYLLVAKIVASGANPDQVFMRVYGANERVERDEPGRWSVVGPPFRSNLVFDWLQLHINSKMRQRIDEIRLGNSWSSVTAPWISAAGARSQGMP